MATHDYDIANQSGAAFRTDLNNALAAIQSNNSNSSSPSTTVAYQWWADTTNGVLKIRNSANNAWVELFQLDGTLTLEDGSASTPALAFRDDLNTGVYSSAADKFNVATGGVERMELGSQTVFNEDGADVDFRIEGDTAENLFRIDAGNDRVGINTSSPNQKLHLAHSSGNTIFEMQRTDTNVTGGVGTISFTASDGHSVGSIGMLGDGDDQGGVIFFRTTSAAANNDPFNAATPERMRLDGSGRLLLGTTTVYSATGGGNMMFSIAQSATSRTDVSISNQSSGDNASAALVLATHGQDYILEATGSGNSTDGASAFRISKGTTARFHMASDGKIGIGNASPQQLLHVWPDIADTSSSYVRITAGDRGSGTGLDLGHDASGNTHVNAISNADLIFSTNNTERMRLDNNGVLGIGTTSPRSSTGIHLSKSGGEAILEMQRNDVNTTGNVGMINFTASDGHSVANMGAFGDGDNEGAYLSFKTTSAASANSPYGTNTTEGLRINSNQSINAQGVYNDTTSSGANVNVHSDGHLRRSTSSRRYKNTITDATHGLTELLKLKSVTFKGNEDGDTIFGGLIAEDVHDAGLTEFVQYDKDNEPDALAYGNMVALCVKAIQELTARVATLEAA